MKSHHQVRHPLRHMKSVDLRVSVIVFPYSVMNDKKQVIKRGVGVGLNNIMKVKDGEAFAGKASAESDFKDFVGVEEEASILD